VNLGERGTVWDCCNTRQKPSVKQQMNKYYFTVVVDGGRNTFRTAITLGNIFAPIVFKILALYKSFTYLLLYHVFMSS